MELKIENHVVTRLGTKAVVIVVNGTGGEMFRDEVCLWQEPSRKKFIDKALLAANGHLSGDKRAELQKKWDGWLHQADGNIQQEIKRRNAQVLSASASQPAPEMQSSEREEALNYLHAPDLITKTQDDLTAMGIVGEDRNKVLVHLAATSRKMNSPQALTIESQSSSGKNHLVGRAIELIPPEDVKYFTGGSSRALNYVGEHGLEHKLVIFAETVGKSDLEYQIRVLLSEKFLKMPVAVAEWEGGPRKTKEFTVYGPIAYIDTTTASVIHPENATRVFELHLDESTKQTEVINKQQLRESGPEGVSIRLERQKIKRLHHNVQRLLKPGPDVIIPFSNFIRFPAHSVRARRDCDRFINLIKTVTFYYQYQRETAAMEDGKQYLFATIADYAVAYELSKDIFADLFSGLSRRAQRLLETVIERAEGSNPEGVYTRDEIAEWVGSTKDKLNDLFLELEREEFLLDAAGDPIIPGKRGPHGKREYRLNWELVELSNAKITDGIRGLTTPEELAKLVEAASAEPPGDADGAQNPNSPNFPNFPDNKENLNRQK
jgi:hypothetical protein